MHKFLVVHPCHTKTSLLVSLLFCLAASPAQAFTTILQAEVADKHVEHVFTDTSGGDVGFKGDMVAGILGLAVVNNNFYVNLSGELPWKDSQDFQREINSVVDLTRKDYSFTIGYNLPRGWSIFGGYKYGKTSAHITSFEQIPGGPAILNTLDFKESGPYLGTSYSFPINSGNNLSISAAYAFMDGEINNRLNPAGGGGSGTGSAEGDANGFSLAIKWIHEVSASTSFNMALKYNSYENELTETAAAVPLDITFDSDYRYITIGLSHVF